MNSSNQLILHIPHASTFFPHLEGFIINAETLQNEISKLTDWFTDELFYMKDCQVIQADFSRIFCDVERFVDDEMEVMSKYGMGVLYEKTDDGKLMRKVSPEIRKQILNTFYFPHHQNLLDAVNYSLEKEGNALIIDCHSFSNIPFVRDLHQQTDRPDINIGTDHFHTPKKLLQCCVDYFEKKSFSVGINWPYSGSIVPMEHYQKNKNVHSILIEINRKLYLDESTTTKAKNFEKTKEMILGLLNKVSQINL